MKIMVYYLDLSYDCPAGNQPLVEGFVSQKLKVLQTEFPLLKIKVLPSYSGKGDRIEMIDMTAYPLYWGGVLGGPQITSVPYTSTPYTPPYTTTPNPNPPYMAPYTITMGGDGVGPQNPQQNGGVSLISNTGGSCDNHGFKRTFEV